MLRHPVAGGADGRSSLWYRSGRPLHPSTPGFAVEASPQSASHGLPPARRFGRFAGPVLFLPFLFFPPPAGLEPPAWRLAGVGLWMAVWWITEAVPIPATALLPVVLFPLIGAADLAAATSPYANPVIFLFLGGFLIAQAVQRWGLHRRIALSVLRAAGTGPERVVGAFMLATALLSMWVSNTATAVMMLPIGLSVVELTGRRDSRFAIALMLGIAYAASIGGVGTLVGTPPNALLAGFMRETYGITVGFAQWMLVAVPLVAVMLPIAWLVLTRLVFRVRSDRIEGWEDVLARESAALGRPGRGEVVTAAVFALTALAWILRPLLGPHAPSDAGIAITGGLLLFVLPVDGRRGVHALDWATAVKLPWDVLLLFGGGLSLAGAISRSGLADWLGSSLAALGFLPLLAVMGLVTVLIIFLTELTSNTATTAAFLPILAALAVGLGQNPFFLVVPAALAASCAFMLPVATPPNAIVYGSGCVTIPRMARAGVVLNVLFAMLIPLATYALLAAAFGARAGVLPEWARAAEAIPRP